MSKNVEIANIIMSQLGGNRFKAMTGAKMFLAIQNGLQFKLPARFAKDGINCITIVLTPADLYDIKYMRVRGTSCKVIAETNGAYADMLRVDFEVKTGLYTSL